MNYFKYYLIISFPKTILKLIFINLNLKTIMKRKLSELSNLADDLEINISKKCTKDDTIRTYCRMRNGGKATGRL
jgi:hypothetical protein